MSSGSCGGSSHPKADGGADAAVDAASDAAAPSGCEDFVPDGDRACVPSGRFWFGWIADDEVGNDFGCEPSGFLQALNFCAHEIDLAAFEIDLREVSVGAYSEAVAAGAVPCRASGSRWLSSCVLDII